MTQTMPAIDPRPSNGDSTPALTPPPLVVQSYGITDRGRKRATNEDQFLTATLMRALWIEQSSVPQSGVHYADDRGHVFIVADGMGGVEGGEKASALAVGAIEGFLLNVLRWLISLDGATDGSVLREFKAALQSADACVYAAASSSVELRGMGTTLTMAYSRGADLFVAHVGDSRCYMLRRGALRRLTHDDTLVNQMVEDGRLPPEAAEEPALRHVITNVVGGAVPGVRAEVHRLKLESGDALLLCTDGLSGAVTDDQIAVVMAASTSPGAACAELVRIANENAGADNVTVVVARYT